MKPAPFDYVRPRDLGEAIAVLGGREWGVRILAGGQSLVPMLNLRLSPVSCLVDISRLEEMRRVEEDADGMTFGACIRHGEFEDGTVPDPALGMMRHVARSIAYRAVRNRGTIGGSIALADPSADWIPVVLALGARFLVRGQSGEREVTGEDMVTGPYTTALGEQDILVAIRVPKLARGARWGSHKIVRKTGEYPMTTAAVVVDPARGACGVVLGAANRGVLRMTRTADRLRGAANWSGQGEASLREAILADLDAAGRNGDPYDMKLSETTVLRAARAAMMQ